MEPKSKKANYVRKHAPDFCCIRFVCKGRLICTRYVISFSYFLVEDLTVFCFLEDL